MCPVTRSTEPRPRGRSRIFPISGLAFSRSFLRALGLIKAACRRRSMARSGCSRQRTGRTDRRRSQRSRRPATGTTEFPIDIFQTGSGTSTNMNANEVIASRAARSPAAAVRSTRTTTSTCARAATTSSPRRFMSPPYLRSRRAAAAGADASARARSSAEPRRLTTSSRPAARI